jgi:hypothetical protein
MKKLSPIFLILSLLTLIINPAQAQRLEDVVYLSNGTIIHGILLNDSTSQTVRILNHEGDTWAFNRVDIDSIKREKAFEYKAKLFNQPGVEVNINAEFLLRSGNNAIGKAAIPGINLGLGYRFNPFLSAGTEIGMEFYDWMEIPISSSLRVRTSGRALSQLIFLRAGYTLPAEKRADDWDYSYKSRGGIHTTIGAGIERIINENASFLFTFSYHYQELNYHLSPMNQWAQERDRTEAYSRLRLTLGYVFK